MLLLIDFQLQLVGNGQNALSGQISLVVLRGAAVDPGPKSPFSKHEMVLRMGALVRAR